MVTDAEIDAGIEAILAKDDTEIMMDELRNLFGADIDVDSRFTIAQVLTAMESSHRLAVEFSHIVERAKAEAAKRARPTADLGEERKRALDELRVAAQICEIDENPIVREQALRIRAARDVLSRSA